MVECESLTTISVAPPATAPSRAASPSASRSRRPAAASGPSPTHCAQSTTPAVPSMSLDRKTFMPAPSPGDGSVDLEPFAPYDAGSSKAKAHEIAAAYGLGYVIRQEL